MDLGFGSAIGTFVFDADLGEISYTPDPSEMSTTVDKEYLICNDSGGTVIVIQPF